MSNEGDSANPPIQELDDWFLDLLACPACEYHRPLKRSAAGDVLLCGCGKYAFPIRDGIPILLVEEAEIVDATADPAMNSAGANG